MATERTLLFPDLEALSHAAATLVEETAAEAVRARGQFSLVLSGGSTPRRLYELLGTEWTHRIPWPQTHLFWSDERFVPADHPESNFRMAAELMIRHVAIPHSNVHSIPMDVWNHTAAADAYEAVLRAYFKDDTPAFDLALLGLGADGHTASLFPGASLDSERWVEAVTGPAYRPPVERITLTLQSLNGSRRTIFLVAGADKREALERIRSRDDLPAARVRPREDLIWMVAP